MEVRSAERGSSVERRDNLYESLDSKVGVVNKLVSICAGHIDDKTGGALSKDIKEFENNFLSGLDSGIRNGLDSLDSLDSEIKVLQEEVDSVSPESISSLEALDEANLVMDQLDAKFEEKRSVLLGNDTLLFASEVRNFCEGIKGKIKKVNLMRGNKEMVLKEIINAENLDDEFDFYPDSFFNPDDDIGSYFGSNLNSDSDNKIVNGLSKGVETIKYGSFWIGVVFTDEVYNKFFEVDNASKTLSKTVGVYVDKTPIFRIRGRNMEERVFDNVFNYKTKVFDIKRIKSVLDHELIHLALDGCDYHYNGFNLDSLVVSMFDRINKLKGSQKDEKLLKLIDHLKPSLAMEVSHQEFLADNICELSCSLGKSIDFNNPNKSFSKILISRMSTVRTRLINLFDVFDDIDNLDGVSQETREIANTFKKNMFDYVEKISQSLLYSGFLANKFGGDAVADFKSLTYILKPNQYRHVPGFLEWKYGKKNA